MWWSLWALLASIFAISNCLYYTSVSICRQGFHRKNTIIHLTILDYESILLSLASKGATHGAFVHSRGSCGVLARRTSDALQVHGTRREGGKTGVHLRRRGATYNSRGDRSIY